MSPEKERATNVPPSSIASEQQSMGMKSFTAPPFCFAPMSAVAENWPFVRPYRSEGARHERAAQLDRERAAVDGNEVVHGAALLLRADVGRGRELALREAVPIGRSAPRTCRPARSRASSSRWE